VTPEIAAKVGIDIANAPDCVGGPPYWFASDLSRTCRIPATTGVPEGRYCIYYATDAYCRMYGPGYRYDPEQASCVR